MRRWRWLLLLALVAAPASAPVASLPLDGVVVDWAASAARLGTEPQLLAFAGKKNKLAKMLQQSNLFFFSTCFFLSDHNDEGDEQRERLGDGLERAAAAREGHRGGLLAGWLAAAAAARSCGSVDNCLTPCLPDTLPYM